MYQERATPVAGAVLWQRTLFGRSGGTRIVPDGCLDLLWDGNRLFVAGPDTAARWHPSPADVAYVAVRFSGGLGPALLGFRADEVRDRSPNLEELWPSRQARLLSERVEADPAAVLEAWVVERAARCDLDPFGPRVLAMAKAGSSMAAMADRLGISTRQLHRRCLAAFGYGPRRLARVMRFGRALEEIRRGAPLAQVAAACGYADQAHLSREVRTLAGTTPMGLLGEPYVEGSGANRSTGRPSGSWTTA
jgi:AraC-like DNA-binding protein